MALIDIICPAVGLALALIGKQLKEIKAVQIRTTIAFQAFSPYNWDREIPPQPLKTFFRVGLPLALVGEKMKFDEKIPGESALAFQYFELYRDTNPSDRSLRKLTKVEINGKKRSLRTIGGWASQFYWQERVKVFDAENTRRAAEQIAARQQAEIEEFIEEDLQIARDFQLLIKEQLAEIKTTVGDPDNNHQKPNIRQLRQLALAYRESRLWIMELTGILQEKNDETTKTS